MFGKPQCPTNMESLYFMLQHSLAQVLPIPPGSSRDNEVEKALVRILPLWYTNCVNLTRLFH